MTVTTKAALAAELGISKSRVSQYVKAGLPVRSDGKLDRGEALSWLNRNQPGLNTQDKGATRAARLAADAIKPSPRRVDHSAPPASRYDDETVPLTLVADLLARSSAIVATAAVEAGASMPIAYAMSLTVFAGLACAADDLLGVPPASVSPLEAMTISRDIEPDWRALASRAAEPFDMAAWEAFADHLPPATHPDEGRAI